MRQVRIASASKIGSRKSQEDVLVHWTNGDIVMTAVNDGHAGPRVSKAVPKMLIKLAKTLTPEMFRHPKEFTRYITESFVEIDEELVDKLGQDALESGSTCCAGFYCGSNGIFYSANLGDSRGVFVECDIEKPLLKKSSMERTVDHKPGSAVEKRRIEAAGGVVRTKNAQSDVPRVGGSLAISRVFGDWELKSPFNGSSKHWAGNKVDIIGPRYLNDPDKQYFLFFASDGVWDVMTNATIKQKAIKLAKERDVEDAWVSTRDMKDLVDEIVDECLVRWNKIGRGAGDNCSIIAMHIV